MCLFWRVWICWCLYWCCDLWPLASGPWEQPPSPPVGGARHSAVWLLPGPCLPGLVTMPTVWHGVCVLREGRTEDRWRGEAGGKGFDFGDICLQGALHTSHPLFLFRFFFVFFSHFYLFDFPFVAWSRVFVGLCHFPSILPFIFNYVPPPHIPP